MIILTSPPLTNINKPLVSRFQCQMMGKLPDSSAKVDLWGNDFFAQDSPYFTPKTHGTFTMATPSQVSPSHFSSVGPPPPGWRKTICTIRPFLLSACWIPTPVFGAKKWGGARFPTKKKSIRMLVRQQDSPSHQLRWSIFVMSISHQFMWLAYFLLY